MAKRRKSNIGSPAGKDDYEVGYGKPPRHSQFKPGQSGNPAGRRKGLQNLKTDVMRTLETPVRVKVGGRMRNQSTQQGALMVLRGKALRGDVRSLDALLALALRHNNDPVDAGPAEALPADDQAILNDFRSECANASTQPATANSADDPPAEPANGAGKKAAK